MNCKNNIFNIFSVRNSGRVDQYKKDNKNFKVEYVKGIIIINNHFKRSITTINY
jgi:hypothetical protein